MCRSSLVRVGMVYSRCIEFKRKQAAPRPSVAMATTIQAMVHHNINHLLKLKSKDLFWVFASLNKSHSNLSNKTKVYMDSSNSKSLWLKDLVLSSWLVLTTKLGSGIQTIVACSQLNLVVDSNSTVSQSKMFTLSTSMAKCSLSQEVGMPWSTFTK